MSKALYFKGTDRLILALTDRQLRDLTRLLQDESTRDRDYFVNESTLRFLESRGCDPALLAALRKALKDSRPAAAPTADPAAYRGRFRPNEDLLVGGDASTDEEGVDVEWRDA